MLQDVIAYLRELNIISMMLRLICAVLAGSIIGIDRGMKRRGAGIKTHVLVCLGATLVMMTGQYINVHFGNSHDIARLGAQVVSGIGFLGVGTIIVTGRNQVRGLTTAAGIWACACIGLPLGIGFYEGALFVLVLVEVTFVCLAKVDDYVFHHSRVLDLYVEADNMKHSAELMKMLRKMSVRISNYETVKTKQKNDFVTIMATIELNGKSSHDEVLRKIREMQGILYVEEL